MTQMEADTRDARRYRMMRLLLCASEDRQREVHALIAHLVGSRGPLDAQRIDRAMDLILNTYKLV
jgi:hypothetical protein